MQSTQHRHRLYLRAQSCALVGLVPALVPEVFNFNLFSENEKTLDVTTKAVLKKVLQEKKVRVLELVIGTDFGFEESCEILNKKPLRRLLSFELETTFGLDLQKYTWHYFSLAKNQDSVTLRGIGIEKAWLRSLIAICKEAGIRLCTLRRGELERKPLCTQNINTKFIEFLSIWSRIHFWFQAYWKQIFICVTAFCIVMCSFNYKLGKAVCHLKSTTTSLKTCTQNIQALERDRQHYDTKIKDLESSIGYNLQIATYQAYWPEVLSLLQESLHAVGPAWLESLEAHSLENSPKLELTIKGTICSHLKGQKGLDFEGNKLETQYKKLIAKLCHNPIEAISKSRYYPMPEGRLGFELGLILALP